MDTTSIIVAIASPPGPSLRGIVRVSGEGCLRLVGALAEVAGAVNLPRGVHRAKLRAPAPMCPCLIVAMPGDASSTGEECAEIHAAGNPVLLERIVGAMLEIGGAQGAASAPIRRALPGEFSARAVLNGRMTLGEAERVAHAVAAATDAQLSAANALRTHARGAATASAADRVATLLALVEAGIDFTDQEDVCAIAPHDLAERANAIAAELEAHASAQAGAEAKLAAPLVVLAGEPNAGKSSLFNALVGRTRMVAAPTAGTTRDVVREPIELPGGTSAVLADAPGLDDAASALDVLMRQHAEQALADADLVLWCVPVEKSVGDGRAVAWASVDGAVLVVRTMCDRAPQHTTAPATEHISTSAVTGSGLPELRTAIARALAARTSTTSAERTSLRSVHAELEHEAAEALRAAAILASTARADARQLPSPELLAASLRAALDRLGEVAGAIPPDDVLGRLFSQFCIGK